MSIDDEVSVVGSIDVLPARREFAPRPEAEPMRRPGAPTWRTITLWVVLLVAVVAVVLVAVEPLFQQREQAMLLDDYRSAIERAANQATGLGGVEVSRTAPEFGSPVGIVEIGAIGTRQVVVEGATSPIMQNGPGHVPGTAAPGQPGNAVVVGRASLFGAPFADLASLAEGDRIGVTTTQGQSVYTVSSNESVTFGEGDDSIDAIYGPSDDDRLTLVTSDTALPFNSSVARVVVATMEGKPFAPTPQNGRSVSQTGTTGETARWPMVLLALLCLAGSIVVAVVLRRRSSARIAYLLTAPPLLTFAIIASETLSQLLPAWT